MVKTPKNRSKSDNGTVLGTVSVETAPRLTPDQGREQHFVQVTPNKQGNFRGKMRVKVNHGKNLLEEIRTKCEAKFGAEAADWDPIVFLAVIAADETQSLGDRIDCAKAVAKYTHPAMKAIELKLPKEVKDAVDTGPARQRLATMAGAVIVIEDDEENTIDMEEASVAAE